MSTAEEAAAITAALLDAGPRTREERDAFFAQHGIRLDHEAIDRLLASNLRHPTPAATPAGQALVRLMPVWRITPTTWSETPRTVDGAPYPSKVDTSAVMACMENGAQFTERTADALSVLQAALWLRDYDVLAALFTSSHKLTTQSMQHWAQLLRDAISSSHGLTVPDDKENAAQLWALGSMAFPEFVADFILDECLCSGPQIVRGLLQLGADPNCRGHWTVLCNSPLQYLSRASHPRASPPVGDQAALVSCCDTGFPHLLQRLGLQMTGCSMAPTARTCECSEMQMLSCLSMLANHPAPALAVD
jgi:hypothetical protein